VLHATFNNIIKIPLQLPSFLPSFLPSSSFHESTKPHNFKQNSREILPSLHDFSSIHLFTILQSLHDSSIFFMPHSCQILPSFHDSSIFSCLVASDSSIFFIAKPSFCGLELSISPHLKKKNFLQFFFSHPIIIFFSAMIWGEQEL